MFLLLVSFAFFSSLFFFLFFSLEWGKGGRGDYIRVFVTGVDKNVRVPSLMVGCAFNSGLRFIYLFIFLGGGFFELDLDFEFDFHFEF